MENTRLAKIIFLWDYQLNENNWSSIMNIIFEQSNNSKIFYNLRECCIDSIYEKLMKHFASYGHDQIQYKPKLRTYITLKINFATELYVYQSLSKSRRSLMTQSRLEILPLEIETGRLTPIYDKTIKKNRKMLPSERICKLCDNESCEFHFIFIYPKYNEIRHLMKRQASNKHS